VPDRDPPEPWSQVPRLDLRIGRELWSSWTTMGRIGAGLGALLFVALMLIERAPVAAAIAIPALNVAGFYGWRWLSTLWRKRRRYVLLEHALIAAAGMVGVAYVAGADVEAVADAWMAALALALALGRIGCLFMGCCHGRVASRGLRYPWLPPWACGETWNGIRVTPVQAVEAAVLMALAVLGTVLTLATHGWSACVVPALYAVARFELELWRGDVRRYIGRLSHNQWSCLVLIALTAFRPVVAITAATLVAGMVVVQHARVRAPRWSVGSVEDLAALDRAVAITLAQGGAHLGAIELTRDRSGGVVLRGVTPAEHGLARAAAVAAAASAGRGAERDRA
jgi:hypothetical protein